MKISSYASPYSIAYHFELQIMLSIGLCFEIFKSHRGLKIENRSGRNEDFLTPVYMIKTKVAF